MAYVKLDTKILNSTTWLDSDACKIFITALLMAEPYEVREPMASVNVRDTNDADFVVPTGWYGLVPAAGPGIAHSALIGLEPGLAALERLAAPDPSSRTPAHEGRRMVRINGGYLILNYMLYRDRDHTIAERQARFRLRKRVAASNESNTVTITPVTHADADAHEEDQDQKPSVLRTDAVASEPTPLPDPIWGTGLAFLKRKGIPEKQARSLLGKLRKATDDITAGALLSLAEAEDVSDPAAWLMAAAERKRSGPQRVGKTMQAIQSLERMKANHDAQDRPELPRLAAGRDC